MVETKIIPIVNKNLFSNYYLDNRVKTIPEWKKNDHIVAFSEIKKLYEEERKSFENFNEAQLIKHFLDPIFKILLFESEVEEAVGGEFPDYAFFRDKNSRDEAHKNKGTISFYTNALAIGEVKKWVTELDGKPIHQLRNYLDVTEKKWGILTNGRKWRLFCKEKKRDEYYEVDLPSLLDNNDVEGFKYFFYFFRRDAFLFPDSFLEGVLRESEVHAKTIGNNLKENVYKAMKKIAEGFFGRPQNNLDRNDEAARERVQKNTMLLLYRLLFLLYAEDRNLLDLTNTKYLNNHSFRRIKKEVEEKRGRIEQGYDYSGTTIWDRLKSLFELINVGSEAIGEKEFHVPAYNGGLFDTKKNPELDEKWKIGDKYLAEAIHLLTWSDVNGAGGFVDYSELEIRHLGSIYEGLLEYKLKVAESDIVTKENEWVSLEKYNEGRKQKKAFEEFDEFSRARKGELYLATDKGERKATGSYYTPDYIVNYIVRNTIGAVVDEKWKETQEKNKRFIDATLSVKLLDPAMGSGHFLVGAVDFLAEKLMSAAQKDIEAGRLAEEARYSDLDWARREVVAQCIYGVDLNPMAVELAKVSLWLKTISKDKPLSFLDHRLKCGNSLIGADLGKLAFHPYAWQRGISKAGTRLDISRPKAFVEKVVNLTNKISAIDDETLEHIKEKEHLFNDLQNSEAYQNIKKLADLFTSVYFGNEIDEKRYAWLSSEVYGGRKIDEKTYTKVAYSLADNKRFFHWELEFPEIFFEEGKIKENPGFDAVVGNPPWGAYFEEMEKEYNRKEFSEIVVRMVDSFMFFLYKGFSLLKKDGFLSEIVPNPFFIQVDIKLLRAYFLKNSSLIKLLNLGDGIFGPEVTTPSCVFVLSKNIPKSNSVKVVDLMQLDIGNKIQAISKQSFIEEIVPQVFFQMAHNHSFITKGFTSSNIITKLGGKNPKLSEFLKDKIERGISADLNDAYILYKSELEKNKLENIKCKPVIDGSSISKYYLSFNDKHIIYLSRNDEIDKYPSIKNYLLQFKDKIKCKEVLSGRHPWFALHRPRDEKIFGSPKLVGLTTTDRIIVSIDLDGYYSMDSLYNINFNAEKYNIFYFATLLNSHLVTFIYRYFAQEENRILPQVKAENLYSIPIRRISFTTPK